MTIDNNEKTVVMLKGTETQVEKYGHLRSIIKTSGEKTGGAKWRLEQHSLNNNNKKNSYT